MQFKTTSVQVLDRAAMIIDVVSSRLQATKQELVAETGLNVTTVYRLLASLCEHGFLRKNEDNTYSIGWKFYTLASVQIDNLDFITLALPILRTLAKELSLQAMLCVLNQRECTAVAAIDADQKINISALGMTLPDYACAVGKAILAQFSEEEIISRFRSSPFEVLCDNTIVTLGDMKKELAKVRSQGFAVSNREYTVGPICLAVPVFNYRLDVIGAICVRTEYDEETFRRELDNISAHSVRAAMELSQKMGYFLQ